MLGRQVGNRNNKKKSRGYAFLHHAVDDHSRLAYSEILDDERKETASAFWERANAFFQAAGITVTAVMTDNGSCYRSRDFATALGTIKHRWTRPYRPQTNGKVERFNRTLATEWAYAASYASDEDRAATYQDWIHHYNHHRPHTGIGGQTPADRVHNLTGKNTALTHESPAGIAHPSDRWVRRRRGFSRAMLPCTGSHDTRARSR